MCPATQGMLGDHLLCLKMADVLNIFAALEQDECEITSCTIPDSNDDIILLAAVACFVRRELRPGLNVAFYMRRIKY